MNYLHLKKIYNSNLHSTGLLHQRNLHQILNTLSQQIFNLQQRLLTPQQFYIQKLQIGLYRALGKIDNPVY